MDFRQLGSTEMVVSSIGVGCVTFGREIDHETSFAVMDRAIERGITLFDTAEAYARGESEKVLGRWIESRGVRDKVVVATKVTSPLNPEHVIASADASLKRLRTDRIDLFQLHCWDGNVPLDEQLGALGELVEQGKARFVGCSNWQAWQLCKALLLAGAQGSVRLQSVQPPYNLVQREIEPDLLPLCADQKIGVLAYSPLGAGFLTGKYHRNGEVPKGTRFDVIPDHQQIYFTSRGFQVVEGLRSLSAELREPMLRLALAWVLRRETVTSVLVGCRSPDHIDQAIGAQQMRLPEEALARLDRLGVESGV